MSEREFLSCSVRKGERLCREYIVDEYAKDVKLWNMMQGSPPPRPDLPLPENDGPDNVNHEEMMDNLDFVKSRMGREA